jgi:hypothetical protein
MKRIALIFLLIGLGAVAVMAQSIDLQLAVTTQALTRDMLKELNLTESEIRNILRLQEQFRLLKEENNLEMNVIKAELARMLYKPDADKTEVNRLLERAGELRLTQEQAQVETYQRIRGEMGEESWARLMRQVRAQTRAQTQSRPQTAVRSSRPETAPSSTGGDSPSAGSPSGGSSSGSNSSGGSAHR